ncbi:MAG: indole-3-glycerol phosphate synthase TrpC [Candidatus Pelagibacter sp. TMED263]|nr:MAG: indole-3-glycerol phosphate synthase TrpC [Candidatus Pelagibacter sp. TMED263]|tara:strand:+ start:269 stop:1063 length:795 start_codon:yes stop_codon:yes gene_type:complete
MPNVLEKIIEEKKKLLKLIKKNNSLDSLEEKIKNLKCFLSFKEAIQNNKGVSLITEIKKASPSAGVIIKDFDHLKIAEKYINNGATCLSVLTEEKFFLGNHKYIQDIKNNFKIPILTKDFFIDPYQVTLSKSFGSDCILIIIAALDTKLADEIYSEALRHNLSVIVEVHDQKEAETALKYDHALIGINNRNLKTLEVSINNTISIFEIVKNHKNPLISESGIKNENDAKHIFEKTGIKNFLIGESLLTSDNPEELIKKLKQINQ